MKHRVANIRDFVQRSSLTWMDGVFLLVLAWSVFFFFFRLSYGTLKSFDEAWYAAVAKNVSWKNPLHLSFNGNTFVDHPPFIIWLMAVSQKMFAATEFASRAVSAASGVISMYLLYRIGIRMHSKLIGVLASIMLVSSLWFAFRARSGNLDIPFVGVSLLVVFLLLKTRESFRFFIPLCVALACLLLSKTLIGIPLVFLVLIGVGQRMLQPEHRITVVKGIGVFFLLLLPWYVYNARVYDDFFAKHVLEVGLRITRDQTMEEVKTVTDKLLYLQSGIGRWYTIAALVAPFTLLTLRDRRTWLIFIWFTGVLLPFTISSHVQIWHLLPVYAPLFLLTARGVIEASKMGSSILHIIHVFVPQKLLLTTASVLVMAVALVQTKQLFWLVVARTPTVGGEADVALHAKAYPGTLHLKDVVVPAVVFYADRTVDGMGFVDNAYQNMVQQLHNTTEKHVFIIKKADKAMLQEDGVPFVSLYENWEYTLIANYQP